MIKVKHVSNFTTNKQLIVATGKWAGGVQIENRLLKVAEVKLTFTWLC